ncbi:pilin [Snodgrassella sp. B3882]|uniref:pilin n=1 Tax=Snodgrassella sp. B3882 TaxID=2818037 RepID=UPI002269A604|nr:pilin [Snodgrassella sp. B3882]MCX8744988.1 pilin [Snodgrassella sp. B3882]
MFNISNNPNSTRGFTLIQILITVSIIIILASISFFFIHRFQRFTALQQAQALLLVNSQHLEKNYQHHASFKQNSTTWIKLYSPQNQHFCVRILGNPLYHDGNSYALKAVSLDKKREPRILKLNRHGTILLCQSSESTCEEKLPFFSGDINVDKHCTIFNR